MTTQETISDGSDDLRLWIRLLACTKIVEKTLRRNFQQQFDTTLPRFDVLAALDRAKDGLSMGDLSRALLVSNGNITSIVRQLLDQDLLASRLDRSDRRSLIVSLSEKGQKHFDELALAHRAWVCAELADMPKTRQGELADLLGELKSVLS